MPKFVRNAWLRALLVFSPFLVFFGQVVWLEMNGYCYADKNYFYAPEKAFRIRRIEVIPCPNCQEDSVLLHANDSIFVEESLYVTSSMLPKNVQVGDSVYKPANSRLLTYYTATDTVSVLGKRCSSFQKAYERLWNW